MRCLLAIEFEKISAVRLSLKCTSQYHSHTTHTRTRTHGHRLFEPTRRAVKGVCGGDTIYFSGASFLLSAKRQSGLSLSVSFFAQQRMRRRQQPDTTDTVGASSDYDATASNASI